MTSNTRISIITLILLEEEFIKKEIPELYAFTNEKINNMEQEFIDEVARQLKEGKEQLYAAIQLLNTGGSEHSWAFRFQQVEKIDPNLVNFEIAHYYTYGSNNADIHSFINKPTNEQYSYFDFMVWFYFLKGIIFNYNDLLFMKITEEYNEKKYYFGDKITVDEYIDSLINKYRAHWPSDMKEYLNELIKEEKQKEQLGEIQGYVRNPFLREYAVPITNDIILIETPKLTSCLNFNPYKETEKIKVYHGHKYERFNNKKF